MTIVILSTSAYKRKFQGHFTGITYRMWAKIFTVTFKPYFACFTSLGYSMPLEKGWSPFYFATENKLHAKPYDCLRGKYIDNQIGHLHLYSFPLFFPFLRTGLVPHMSISVSSIHLAYLAEPSCQGGRWWPFREVGGGGKQQVQGHYSM